MSKSAIIKDVPMEINPQNIPPEVSRATEVLKKANFEAYLIGGCVRDLLLKKTPKDWDITTNATPEEIVDLFPKTFYENTFGTVTVVNEETPDEAIKNIEITPFRLESGYSDKRHPDQVKWGEKLEDDLSRRDFTINALAYNTRSSEIIDLYGGLNDLKDKSIKAVGNALDRFNEDPLRMLRAIRFASQLGFSIESNTATAIQSLSEHIKHVSMERIRDEFSKIIMSEQPMIGVIMANRLSLLKYFLPELEEGIHVKQNGDHIYDVWEHTLRVLQHSADKNFPFHVRLACLFHDIGKPKTRRFDETKKDYTFYGHEVVGAKMARTIMNRLKFPVKLTETVVKLVRNHMFFSDIDKITLSAVRRIVANVGRENVWDLMNLRFCDRIGMGRPKEEPYRLRKYESMIEEAMRAPTSVTMLKINGNDVSREAKLPPGPKIGFILHALLEDVLENPELNTTEFLTKKAKTLAKLDESELKKLGESGKRSKEEAEQKEINKIKTKYHVK